MFNGANYMRSGAKRLHAIGHAVSGLRLRRKAVDFMLRAGRQIGVDTLCNAGSDKLLGTQRWLTHLSKGGKIGAGGGDRL